MITPAYAITATERVLPRMALDFTTGVLDSRVTVTRALNTATAINSSGFIAIVNADLPRFDYDPVTLAPKGLLIEESRANLLLRSEEFDFASWSKADVTVTANATTSPDGTVDADKLIPNTNTADHFIHQGQTINGNNAMTISVFVKAAEYTTGNLRLEALSAPFNSLRLAFDLTAGTITPTAYQSAVVLGSSILNMGNGWYRISISGTTGFNGTHRSRISPNISTSYAGNGIDGIFIWGAQLEVGAFATSYIPTTTTSLTRNADAVSMTGTNFSSWYNATSGAILARSRQSVITGTRPSIYISDGTANNIISLRGLVANPELYIKATTDQVQIDAGTLTANSSFGLVGAWTTDNCAAAINGGAAVTDTSATIPTVDQMLIGSDGTNYLNGQVERISYWPQRIINAEAQAFSK